VNDGIEDYSGSHSNRAGGHGVGLRSVSWSEDEDRMTRIARYAGRRTALALFALVAAPMGCATQKQVLTQKQDGAVQTALQRGRFDLNCPSATATVLSSDFIQPAVQGPWVGGLERVEYTVGVAGCNQRRTYVVMCQVGTDTCFAANPEERR